VFRLSLPPLADSHVVKQVENEGWDMKKSYIEKVTRIVEKSCQYKIVPAEAAGQIKKLLRIA
jgi:hypothetical protein